MGLLPYATATRAFCLEASPLRVVIREALILFRQGRRMEAVFVPQEATSYN